MSLTNYRGAPEDVDFHLVRKIETGLVRGRAAVLRELNRTYEGLHIGANEANILMTIKSEPTVRPSSLSGCLGVDSGFISRLLDRLENRSLIVRSRSVDDRRVINLSLTEQGGAMCRQIIEATPRSLGKPYLSLSRAELVELNRLLDKLLGEQAFLRQDTSVAPLSSL